jgi:hypothetical protein
MPPSNPLDPCYLITRDDLVAAFRLWVETFRSEPESIQDVLNRLDAAASYPEACADSLIAFLEEAAGVPEPTSDL